MKTLFAIVVVFIFSVLITAGVMWATAPSKAEQLRQKQHTAELAQFRRAWMADCTVYQPAYACIALWAQVRPESWE